MAPQCALAFEAAGAHALVLSGGHVTRNGFFMLRGRTPLWSLAWNIPSALKVGAQDAVMHRTSKREQVTWETMYMCCTETSRISIADKFCVLDRMVTEGCKVILRMNDGVTRIAHTPDGH